MRAFHNQLSFLLFFLLTAAAWAGARALGPLKPGYPVKAETLNFEVLDMDFEKGLVVFRHQYAVPTLAGFEDENRP